MDGAPRQYRTAESRRDQGGRTPGLVVVGGQPDDRALLPLVAPGGRGRHQGPRLAGVLRHPVPARPAPGRVARAPSRPRWAPGLSEPAEEPRGGGPVHGLDGPRRGERALLGAGRPIPGRSSRAAAARALRGRGRRRRAGRGQRVGGGPRGCAPGSAERPVDRRPEPPEPGSHRFRGPATTAARHVRGGRLEGHRAALGVAPDRPVPAAGRAPAARAPGVDAERGIPRPPPRPGGGGAQGARGDRRRRARCRDRAAPRRDPGRGDPRPRRRRRRARPARDTGHPRRGRETARPALRDHRGHHQGVGAAAGGRSA